MTDEQIKQNAEIYARYNSRANNTAYYAYIEGAHSRDEEIKELEQALAFTEDVVDTQKKELDQFRNPWISVEERIPIEFQPVIVLFDDGVIINAFMTMVKDECAWHPSATIPIGSEVVYWMPIPRIKKGEEK